MGEGEGARSMTNNKMTMKRKMTIGPTTR